MRQPSSRRIRVILAVLTLGVASVEASPPPAGRTYFTVLMGAIDRYELSAECWHFTAGRVCALFGGECGEWRPIDRGGRQAGLAIDLLLLEDEDRIEIDGRARLDNRGPGSSLAGTARMRTDGGTLNLAFAGRAVERRRCPALVEAFEGGPVPDEDVVGSGRVVTESRTVRDFDEVSARDSGRLLVRRTGSESLTITAEDNILPLLESRVRGGRLTLGIRSTGDIRTTQGIVYELTAKDLDEISLDGSVRAEAGGIAAAAWTAVLDGSSRLTAEGRAEAQEVRLSGSTVYLAEGLRSVSATVSLTGSSRAVVRVSDRLEGTVVGSARLEYYGNPTVSVTVTGSATVRRIGD